jgi:heat shock protein HslJ
MKPFVLAFSVSALLLAGCASRPAQGPADTAPGAVRPEPVKLIKQLAGTTWLLVELEGAPVSPPPEGWLPRSLEFEAGGLRVSGVAGANGFGASYEQNGKELEIGRIALTRRLGPAELMEAERRYTHVLSRVTGWRQDGERLVLTTGGDERAAVFERVKKPLRR